MGHHFHAGNGATACWRAGFSMLAAGKPTLADVGHRPLQWPGHPQRLHLRVCVGKLNASKPQLHILVGTLPSTISCRACTSCRLRLERWLLGQSHANIAGWLPTWQAAGISAAPRSAPSCRCTAAALLRPGAPSPAHPTAASTLPTGKPGDWSQPGEQRRLVSL